MKLSKFLSLLFSSLICSILLLGCSSSTSHSLGSNKAKTGRMYCTYWGYLGGNKVCAFVLMTQKEAGGAWSGGVRIEQVDNVKSVLFITHEDFPQSVGLLNTVTSGGKVVGKIEPSLNHLEKMPETYEGAVSFDDGTVLPLKIRKATNSKEEMHDNEKMLKQKGLI